MSDTHEAKIVKAEPAPLEKRERLHPMVELALGAEAAPDPAMMEKYMDLQERWERTEGRKSYTRAMIRLKADLPEVIKHDKLVDYPGKRSRVRYTHASLAKVVEEVTPILTQHGFSHSFNPSVGEKDRVSVTCRLTHIDGHFEECTLEAPPDNSGGKGGVQAMASTTTMLKRHALLALLGIATADMPEPTGEQQPDPDFIDTKLNLKAVEWLKGRGVSQEEAEAHVERSIDKWTRADIEALKAFGAQKGAA